MPSFFAASEIGSDHLSDQVGIVHEHLHRGGTVTFHVDIHIVYDGHDRVTKRFFYSLLPPLLKCEICEIIEDLQDAGGEMIAGLLHREQGIQEVESVDVFVEIGAPP